MPVPEHVISRLSPSVQPLVFETGLEEMPYMTAGTVFMVGYEGKPYVLTTRHGLNPENIGPICVFPSDWSQKIIPLKNVFYVPRTYEAEDFVDLAVIEIDTARITNQEIAQATLIDLALASGEWQLDTHLVDLFILGYPGDKSHVDYETQELRTDRVTLFGRYGGASPIPHLHIMNVDRSHELSTFNGLSGSPVFGWIQTPDKNPRVVFCGMVIRGTASSGLVHFLDRSVLLDALTIKRQYELVED
ncbi:MAG: hypothetical protein WC825_10090 [Gallionellaceae bacterium]|jgi:hypothetical protein